MLAASIVFAGIFAFRSPQVAGSIKGTVTPADGATRVWAVSSLDTLKAPIQAGSFEINGAKPGIYRLIFEARPPYKNTAKENVTVVDGQPTNVGEVKMSQ